MSPSCSTRSTEFPETSSVGQFEIDCEMPCNLIPWTDDSGADEWTDQLGRMQPQVFVLNGDELHVPGIDITEGKTFALRCLCHFLIDQIDNKGLEEVCRSLAEFYVYYRPIDHMPQLPDERTARATVSSRSTSPAFLIGEE